jgi:hypothetical protein
MRARCRKCFVAPLVLVLAALPCSNTRVQAPALAEALLQRSAQQRAPSLGPAARGASLIPARGENVALPASGVLHWGLPLLGLRGGGQSKVAKKRKDEKKAALRQQHEIEERWKTPEEIAAKKAAAAAAADRASRKALREFQSRAGVGDTAVERPREVVTGAKQESDAACEETRPDQDEQTKDVECERAAHEESDVVFLESDEVCVGADGEEVSEALQELPPAILPPLPVPPSQALVAQSRSSHMTDEDRMSTEADEAEEGGEAGWSLRREYDHSQFCLQHPEPVFAAAVSPFAQGLCATGGGDDTVRMWRVAAGDGGGKASRPAALDLQVITSVKAVWISESRENAC